MSSTAGNLRHPHLLLRRRRINSQTTLSLSDHHHRGASPPSDHHRHEELRSNPSDLIREDPIEVLSGLWSRSFSLSRTSPPFKNLTGFLKKFDLWIVAYQRSCAHFTGSFPPVSAIQQHHLRSLQSLQLATLSRRREFRWGAAVDGILLRSPADPPQTKPISRRKLEILLASAPPPFQDRVVQELLLLLLEPILEPRFSPHSHAFRPGRSPHTVLRTLRTNFAGYLWYLKADLTSISHSLSPNLIMSSLKSVVIDSKVLGLINTSLTDPINSSATSTPIVEESESGLAKKRLKRKVLRLRRKKKVLKENEPKPDPYWLRTFFDFAPEEAAKVPEYGHCGILSPLLMNLCLSELDFWLEERMRSYFRPSRHDSIWKNSMEDGCHNPSWPEFVPSSSGAEKTRRMDFIRYGSHILIGIRGPREDAVGIRKEIMDFCEAMFGSRLENAKIEVEHITRGIEFFDHVICRRVIHPTLRYTRTGGNIVSEKGVGTLLSVTASLQRCISQFRRHNLVKGDKDPEPLPCTPMLYSGQAHTNSQMNKFLETMADWYRYADNRKKVVGFCAYVIRSSLAKLYAARYRLKSRAKVYRIARRDLSQPLREATRNSAPEFSDLLRMGLVDAIDGVRFSRMSQIPPCDYTPMLRNWIPEHERLLHEYNMLQDPKFFFGLYKSVRKQNLGPPQEDIAKIVWEYKVCGIWSISNFRNRQKIGSFEEGLGINRPSLTE